MSFGSHSLHRYAAVFATLTLLLSFGLHAVQIEHEHYGTASAHQHGHSTSDTAEQTETTVAFVFMADQMHQSNEKWILLFIVSAYLFIIGTGRTWSRANAVASTLAALSLKLHCVTESRLRNYLTLAFSLGTLNPKPY